MATSELMQRIRYYAVSVTFGGLRRRKRDSNSLQAGVVSCSLPFLRDVIVTISRTMSQRELESAQSAGLYIPRSPGSGRGLAATASGLNVITVRRRVVIKGAVVHIRKDCLQTIFAISIKSPTINYLKLIK